MQGERESDVLRHVGANLRRLRQESGLSQTALAQRSGISRRTIINLEAGEANIGLSSLDQLAQALDSTFVALVAEPSAPAAAVNEVTWRGSSGDSVATLLGSAPAHRETQLWTWTLGVGERYQASPDPAGWHEMLWVVTGRLQVDRADGRSTLEAGDHTIYSSAQEYSYLNVGRIVVQFVRIVVS